MTRWLVAVALLAACRGSEHRIAKRDAGSAPALHVSVPTLPLSPDGVAELRNLDKRIELYRDKPERLLAHLMERAWIRGHLEDYQRALDISAALVEHEPDNADAWLARVQALSHVHEFQNARKALQRVAALQPTAITEPDLAIAEGMGERERALAGRQELAKLLPNPQNLTLLAADLAALGRFDEAIALIPRAAAAIRHNPPQLIAWLLFQWGRIYEQKGELAAARAFYTEAHARLPGYVEATSHLAQTMKATGDSAGARSLVEAALVDNRHPELLALAAELGHPELAAEAQREWERYVAALPLAFSDHVARFYLGVGRDAPRAFSLARINHANRDTHEARALYVETALAANDPMAACVVATPLASSGVRAHRFLAWKALSRCGRRAEADRLATELGIAH